MPIQETIAGVLVRLESRVVIETPGRLEASASELRFLALLLLSMADELDAR